VSAVLAGIDVGTTAVKGIAIDESGAVRASAEAPYPLATPRPGWAEQDPEDWWRATESVLTELCRETGALAGIGLSGQMHGLVALDSEDRVLRPAILWNDQRTTAECRQIEDTLGLERLVQLTGNRALPGFTAPKLLWLRSHEPDVWRRLSHMLLPKDYIRLRLCGERVTDVSDASGTLLLDVAGRRWSDQVLDALELDPEILPPVLESPQAAGTARVGAPGVPVAAGAGDQAAGALGVGVAHPGALSVVLGTSGVVFAATDEFLADRLGRVHAFCHARPESWHDMGVMLSAAGSLGWARDTLAPGTDFESLLREAEGWEPGTEGVTFLPYLAGERTPHVDPDARGAFVGLGLRHDRGALVRAVLEGVAYGLRDSLQLIRDLGIEASVGRVSGGGARSDLWLRIVASALEISLERVAVEEGAAFGAAILGGVAAGVWDDVDGAVAATVRKTATVEPVAEWVSVYRAGHERFTELYPALRSRSS
jgi:xylulokinase